MNAKFEIKKLQVVRAPTMSARIRYWLIKKLAGRTAVMLNTEVKVESNQRGFYLGPGDMYLEGNHFEGDGNTRMDIDSVGNYRSNT